MKATIYEIGPVTNPAYPQTKVGLRSAEDAFKDAEERLKIENEPKTEPVNNLNLRKLRLTLLERSI